MDHPWMYTMDKSGETPATRARKSGYTALAEMLLGQERQEAAKNAPPSRPTPEKDAYWGMSHAVYNLMDTESPSAGDDARDRENPLHRATRDGSVEETQQLLADGADVNKENSQGLTPLHMIALNGRTDIARMLLDSGATINQRENYTGKLTPMAVALLMGYDDLVEVMAEHGGVC